MVFHEICELYDIEEVDYVSNRGLVNDFDYNDCNI